MGIVKALTVLGFARSRLKKQVVCSYDFKRGLRGCGGQVGQGIRLGSLESFLKTDMVRRYPGWKIGFRYGRLRWIDGRQTATPLESLHSQFGSFWGSLVKKQRL